MSGSSLKGLNGPRFVRRCVRHAGSDRAHQRSDGYAKCTYAEVRLFRTIARAHQCSLTRHGRFGLLDGIFVFRGGAGSQVSVPRFLDVLCGRHARQSGRDRGTCSERLHYLRSDDGANVNSTHASFIDVNPYRDIRGR